MSDVDVRTKEIYRVTIVGVIGNIALMVFKFIAGIVGRSSAVIADAIHSLSDLLSDVIVLLFVRISSKPKDSDHQYGHGKYETMATVVIGIILAAVGVGIMIEGGTKIWAWAHGATLEAPGNIALIAALLSIVVKEGLFQYTMRSARKIKSKVLEANAWHHRSDAFSSIATAIGVGGAILLGAQWRVLDPIAAVLVSIMIIYVAIKLSIPAINELLEKAIPEAERNEILAVIGEFPEVSDPHNIRTRNIGPTRSIELHLRMPGSMTVTESHDITRRIERRMREILGPDTIINIHVEPVK